MLRSETIDLHKPAHLGDDNGGDSATRPVAPISEPAAPPAKPPAGSGMTSSTRLPSVTGNVRQSSSQGPATGRTYESLGRPTGPIRRCARRGTTPADPLLQPASLTGETIRQSCVTSRCRVPCQNRFVFVASSTRSTLVMAGAYGNRTHQEPVSRPLTGFEDRAEHQLRTRSPRETSFWPSRDGPVQGLGSLDGLSRTKPVGLTLSPGKISYSNAVRELPDLRFPGPSRGVLLPLLSVLRPPTCSRRAALWSKQPTSRCVTCIT